MNQNWQPATLRPYQPAPDVPADPRSRPIDYVLTQNERTLAAIYTVEALRQRREANKRDLQRRRNLRALQVARELEEIA